LPDAIRLPYGDVELTARLSRGRSLGTLDIREIEPLDDPLAAIRRALERPIGLERNVFQIVRPGESVTILVSDQFRRTRADQVLPVLLDGLEAAGASLADVSVLFACGTHRPPTPDEQRAVLGDATWRRLEGRLFTHDPNNDAELVELGVTRRGTRVRLNRRVVQADRVIVTGAVTMHYFAGYGGGRKSILPGVAAIDTIAHNHALTLLPDSDDLNPDVRIGAMDGNPVAEDMLEAARLARVDYLINVVLDRRGRLADAFAGELEAAHRAAVALARRLFAVPIAERADLVIAASSATRNFVQTHKALFNAWQAMRPGGRIVLAAPCAEGLGGEQFVQWLRLGDRATIVAALRRHSEINGQTALSTVEKGPSTLMVTEMPESDVALTRARKAATLQEAIDRALSDLSAAGRPSPTYYVMPSAAYSVPFVETS
jgi:nickel-dependent lactate racemase